MKSSWKFRTVLFLTLALPTLAQPPTPPADAKAILQSAIAACLKVKTAEYVYVREALEGRAMFPNITATMRQERANVPRVWMAGKFHASGKVGSAGQEKEFAYAYDGKSFRFLDPTENVAKVMVKPGRDGAGMMLAQVGLGLYTFPEFTDENPLEEFANSAGELSYGGTADVEGTPCHVLTKAVVRTMETPRGKQEISQKQHLYVGVKDLLPRRSLFEISGSRGGSRSQATARHLRVNQPFTEESFFVATPAGFAEKLVTETEVNARGLMSFGSAAPEWKLPDAQGKEHALADYRGKIVVLDFWATWCGPCLKAMPGMQQLHEKFKERGVVVIGIDTNDDGKLAADYMKQKNYTYQLLLHGEKLTEYNPKALPTLYVIGKDGRIVHAEVGYRASGYEKLVEVIERQLGSTTMSEEKKTEDLSGARDFDFLHGSWKVQNRMLKERLRGSNEWREFEATLTVRPILNGLGNVDEFKTNIGGTYLEGVTMRIFNAKTKLWSLYWVDNLTMELQVPLVGSFKHGRGEFFADDTHQGTKVKVRFLWSDITKDSARWEQAYSTDGGKTWEVNWVMTFTRSKEL
jgi:thiol-disulfide isomerase/thioredoxin